MRDWDQHEQLSLQNVSTDRSIRNKLVSSHYVVSLNALTSLVIIQLKEL